MFEAYVIYVDIVHQIPEMGFIYPSHSSMLEYVSQCRSVNGMIEILDTHENLGGSAIARCRQFSCAYL